MDITPHQASPELLDTYSEERVPVARDVLEQTGMGTGLLVSRNPIVRFMCDYVVLPVVQKSFLIDMFLYQVSELKINYRGDSLSRNHFNGSYLPAHSGPEAGDRAPQADCLLYPSRQTTSVFEITQNIAAHLFLFTGTVVSEQTLVALRELSEKAEKLFGPRIQAHIIVYGDTCPAQLVDYQGSVLLDNKGSLHATYGIKKSELVYIRPDGYIGLRSQAVEEGTLLTYLSKIYTLREAVPEAMGV